MSRLSYLQRSGSETGPKRKSLNKINKLPETISTPIIEEENSEEEEIVEIQTGGEVTSSKGIADEVI